MSISNCCIIMSYSGTSVYGHFTIMSSVSVVVQEAISTGDPEIVQLCLQSRDHQRHSQRTGDVPSLLKKLREVRLC